MSFGCAGRMMPVKQEIEDGNWESHNQIKEFYGTIHNGVTTIDDLRKNGFDPDTAQNCTKLSHVDIQNIFLPANVFSSEQGLKYVPNGILECLDETIPGKCYGYEIRRKDITLRGKGNFILHYSRLKVITETEGWDASFTFVVKGDRVVHSIWKSTPHIKKLTIERDPKYATFGAGFILMKLLFF